MARGNPLSNHLLIAMAALSGLTSCSYGPTETSVTIENALVKPDSHIFAFSLNYARLRRPTGFLNTFPDGGVAKIESREARVYLVDVDTDQISLLASIPDFAGIPQPKTVWVQGWHEGYLYFRIFGYGGDQTHGDDLSDKREIFYRVGPSGTAEQINQPADDLKWEPATGPLPSPPFLRLSKGYSDIEIGVDGPPGQSKRSLRIILDPDSGVPRIQPGI